MSQNMIEFSSSLKLNEIHIVDNSFNRDPKNIFFKGGSTFGGKTIAKFREMAITGTSIVIQIGSGQF